MATWPFTLKPLRGTLACKQNAQVAEFVPDTGLPNRTPRSLATIEDIQFSISITEDQRQTLNSFYKDDCVVGTQLFSMAHPITDVAYNWLWAESPDVATPRKDNNHIATIKLRRIVV